MTRSDDAVTTAEPAPGTVVDGRYVLSHVLAQRPHGTLWVASLQSTGQSVVLKALDVDHIPDVEQRRAFKAQFEQEITQTGRLAHPHIPRLIDHGSHPQLGRYAVLEHYGGQTLRERLAAEGAIPPNQAAHLMAQVLDALSYAHAMGVVHRDVRPGNVMITARDHAVLLDLGGAGLLSTTTPARADAPRADLGYVAYAAPERLEGGALTPQSDVYAWGLTFVELLDGSPLVRGTPQDALGLHRSPTAHALPGTVPAWLRPVLAQACAKPLDQRFASATDALAALELAIAGTQPQFTGRSSGRRTLIGLLALLSALAASYLFWTSGPSAPGASRSGSPDARAAASNADAEGFAAPVAGQAAVEKAVAMVDPPPAVGKCPFGQSAHLPVGGKPEPLPPTAAVWMKSGGRQLRLVVPRFSATFMSVATAQLALHDPDGRYGLGVYEGSRKARLELADFRKRSMVAVSTPTDASLIARVEVHERLSHRVCLTVDVSGIVAFRLQVVAAIVERDAEAILMNQGIHRRLQYWEPTDPYRIMRRADGLGGFCPQRGATLIDHVTRSAATNVTVSSLAGDLELTAQAPRGSAHVTFERPDGDGPVTMRRAWFRGTDGKDIEASGVMNLFIMTQEHCGELELEVAGEWFWMAFSRPGRLP